MTSGHVGTTQGDVRYDRRLANWKPPCHPLTFVAPSPCLRRMGPGERFMEEITAQPAWAEGLNERQKRLPVFYKGRQVGEFIADPSAALRTCFVVDGRIIPSTGSGQASSSKPSKRLTKSMRPRPATTWRHRDCDWLSSRTLEHRLLSSSGL